VELNTTDAMTKPLAVMRLFTHPVMPMAVVVHGADMVS
jgi:hypothetical protein